MDITEVVGDYQLNNIYMNKITSSASKLVLLYIVAVLGLLALFAGVWSVAMGTFGEAAKIILALFGSAITFVLGFYFGSKGEPSEPFAGK